MVARGSVWNWRWRAAGLVQPSTPEHAELAPTSQQLSSAGFHASLTALQEHKCRWWGLRCNKQRITAFPSGASHPSECKCSPLWRLGYGHVSDRIRTLQSCICRDSPWSRLLLLYHHACMASDLWVCWQLLKVQGLAGITPTPSVLAEVVPSRPIIGCISEGDGKERAGLQHSL